MSVGVVVFYFTDCTAAAAADRPHDVDDGKHTIRGSKLHRATVCFICKKQRGKLADLRWASVAVFFPTTRRTTRVCARALPSSIRSTEATWI